LGVSPLPVVKMFIGSKGGIMPLLNAGNFFEKLALLPLMFTEFF
jgi:hypothetical protein